MTEENIESFNAANEEAEEKAVEKGGYLTQKQEFFCREYITDFNATKAAERAGYAKNTAQEQSSRLLSKAIVRERVDSLIAERAEVLEVTQAWVVKNLKKVAARCLQEIAPLTDSRGKQVKDEKGAGVFVFDTRGANQALELLGKHTGAFRLTDQAPGVTIINVTPQLGEKKLDKAPTPLSAEDEKKLDALLIPKDAAPATTEPPKGASAK